ncbi:MAG: hypothetical protein HKN29_01195 [Rhodothermales bacterium]|nr:hypothetical protein [Rhodothermales bacterium]
MFWVLVGLVIVVGGAWHLAFQRGSSPPERLTAPVAGSVHLEWIDGRDALVKLDDASDEATALGVAHALGRPWLMALYRQAALGRLSEWFGPQTLALDIHVRRMGIPEATVDQLDSAGRELLEAYARGVRAGHSARPWNLLPAAVAMDLELEPWDVTHSLAVERLMAWLSTPIEPKESPESSAFTASRDSVAAFLGLADLDQAVVWVSEQQGLYARLPTGFSGIPPVMSVSIRVGGSPMYEGATLPGLPYRLCGRSGGRAWCKPLTGQATATLDSMRTTPEYFAVDLADGRREVGTREQLAGALFHEGVRLEWTGFQAMSDAGHWARLQRPDQVEGLEGFLLANRGGLIISANTVYPGAPWRRIGSAVGSGSLPGLEALLSRIDVVDDTLSRPVNLLMDTGGGILADSLAPLPINAATADSGAASYLRNWDGRFNGASIAATLYDARRAFGSSAEDSLLAWFGSDRRLWRWELDPLLQLTYPAGQAADLPRRFDPVPWLRDGYPTSPSRGPSRAGQPGRTTPFSAAWEASFGWQEPVHYRIPSVPYEQFLGRSRAAPVRPELATFEQKQTTGRTTVRPPR